MIREGAVMSQPWILVVEDNPDEAQLVCEAFAEAVPGIKITVAGSAGEALARLSGLAVDDWPRLMVTDRHLPDLNGDELIARIRRLPHAKAMALVMVSGGMSPQSGFSGLEWYDKPATWSAWRAWAEKLVVRHLPAGP